MVLAKLPPPLRDVIIASAIPGNNTAFLKWKPQTGYPTIRWGVFYNNVNISGELRVGTYTVKNLEPNKIYKMIICSSLDGKKWTPGRTIQFRTKRIVASKTKVVKTKPKPVPKPPAPRKISKYSVSEVTNASVSLGSNGGTLTWSSQGQNVMWRITDGRGWLSPVLDTPTYTYLYEDLNSANLHIQSSDNNGVSWTLGTEVRSVIPDVDPNDISVKFNLDDSTATITYTKPANKFQYFIIDMQPAPLSTTDGGIALTMGDEATLQDNGKYTFTIYQDNNDNNTSFLTIFAAVNDSYTYGTTVYLFDNDPGIPPGVTDIVQTIRPDGSGVDVSFKGYANYYALDTGYTVTPMFTGNTTFVSYSQDVFPYSNLIFNIVSANDPSNTYLWSRSAFEIAFPQIKNVRVEPGPTSVRISWDPEITVRADPKTWTVIGINDYYIIPVHEPTVEIAYESIIPYSMISITSNIIGQTYPLTRAFFYDPKPEPYEQVSTDNPIWLILFIIFVFYLLKKKKFF
jgi:hypothetical protein